jgi:IPT/TIG domain
MDNHVSY